MRALVLRQTKQPLVVEQRPDPDPAAGEVVIQLQAASLNRRDFWMTQGLYPGMQTPVVLGSDGAGLVTALGAGVDDKWLNAEVIVNPGWFWGDDQAAQSDDFQILGMPLDGTFATTVKAPVDYLHQKPAHLSWSEAAALPLAAVTAYRALVRQGGVKAGENVLITGAGGGVATFAANFALALGANVFVTSSSAAKIRAAVDAGAKAGFNYRLEGWHKEAQKEHGQMHLIIDGAGGDGYSRLLELAAPGGRIVNYGATAGAPSRFDIFKLFWKQLQLTGSTMGSPADFAAMLQLVAEHQLKPVIDQTFTLDNGNDAIARMQSSQQTGKIVLDTTK